MRAAQPRPGSCVCRWHVICEQAGKIETAVGLDPEPFPPSVSALGNLECVFICGNLEPGGTSLPLQEAEMLNYNNICDLHDAS